jgi:hypothetical protein
VQDVKITTCHLILGPIPAFDLKKPKEIKEYLQAQIVGSLEPPDYGAGPLETSLWSFELVHYMLRQ